MREEVCPSPWKLGDREKEKGSASQYPLKGTLPVTYLPVGPTSSVRFHRHPVVPQTGGPSLLAHELRGDIKDPNHGNVNVNYKTFRYSSEVREAVERTVQGSPVCPPHGFSKGHQ